MSSAAVANPMSHFFHLKPEEREILRVDNVKTLKKAGLDSKSLKDSGYDALDLAKAGFEAKELLMLFTPREVMRAGFSFRQLKEAGCTAKDLKDIYSVVVLYRGGYGFHELIDAGYSLRDVAKCGVACEVLRDSSYSLQEICKLGIYSELDLIRAGYEYDDLIMLGYCKMELLDAISIVREEKAAEANAPLAKKSRILETVGFIKKLIYSTR